jgi:hypothetical protein
MERPIAKIRHLIDVRIVKSIEGRSFLSLSEEEEYDCDEDRHRQRTFACKDKQKGIRQAELLWISPTLKESSSVAASAFLHQAHWQMQ